MPTALITGAAGQDGLHLARYLHDNGYRVVGMVQYGTAFERDRIREFVGDIEVVAADLTDLVSVCAMIGKTQPDEVYNLAAISSVSLSWQQPIRAMEVNGTGLVMLLEAIRLVSGARAGRVRVFQASSAQMFGDVEGEWFTEQTPIRPANPYGAAKAYAHFAADAYRRRYDMFVSCGILGNHESSMHDDEFVVRRISRGVSAVAAGLETALVLDNLDATRDWGYAGDFVVAMHLALQNERADDFVIATGELHSVQDVVAAAFVAVGIEDWGGYVRLTGAATGRVHRGVKGDSSKARATLGWSPRVGFTDLIAEMVKSDLGTARSSASPRVTSD